MRGDAARPSAGAEKGMEGGVRPGAIECIAYHYSLSRSG